MRKTLTSIFSVLLVVLMLMGSIIPTQAASVGDYVYISTGSDTYTGYDYTYSAGGGTGGGEFLHMKIRDDANHTVYCVEPNAPFTQTYYQVDNAKNDAYWNSLSKTQREGIALAIIFGYPTQSAKTLGVSSDSDAYAATQAVVWEYAAGVRKSPTEFDTSKPEYNAWYKAIKGSAAETAYKNLRTQMNNYMNSYGYNRDTLIANTKIYMLGSASGYPEQAVIYYDGDIPQMRGAIQVYKKDESGNGLSGAEFTVYDASGKKITVIGPTNNKGYAITEGGADEPLLPYGKYKVVETVFPENYGPAGETSWTVTVDDTVKGLATINAVNRKIEWKLNLTKRCAPGYNLTLSLKGAEYALCKDGEVLKTYTTDSKGKFTTDSYPYGTGYTLYETKAPSGYQINNEVYNLDDLIETATDVDDDNVLDVSLTANEYPDGGQFVLYKKQYIKYTDYPGNGEPEEGAEFVIYNSMFDSYQTAVNVGEVKYFDSCVTDERGRSVWQDGGAFSRALVAGEYIVEQTKASKPGLKLIEPYTVNITSSYTGALGVTSKTFYNEWILEPVELVKVDSETGKVIKDYDATFQIREADTGELVVFEIGESYKDRTKYDTFTTVDGVATLPLGLPYGDYELIEIEAPTGYMLREDPVPFTVSETNDDPIKVEMDNPPKKGTITISKKGSQFTDVTTSKSDYGTIYKAVFTDEYLAGAKFEITATTDIKTNDGTVRYKKGEVVDTLTTTAKGAVTSKELYPGTYLITEVKVPTGYIGSDPIPVTVEAGVDNEITNVIKSIYNEKGSIHVEGEKTASVWETVTDGENVTSKQETVPGEGFTFGLFAKEDIKGSGNAIIKKDSLVDVVVTDKKGKITFDGEYPFGTYYVKELAVPSDIYVISLTKHEVTLSPDDIKDSIEITISLKDKIHNNTSPGPGKVIKVDANTNEPMEGVLIQIKDTNGKVWYKGYTNKNGEINFILESGNYIAQEVKTKEGYILDTKEYPFTIVPGVEPAVVTIKNVPMKGTISIEKFGTQFTGVNELKSAYGTAYKPVFEDKYLAGVEFEIRAKEDIYSPDGKLQYKKGDVVETLVSVSTGSVTSKELWPGKYEVIETKTLDGYKIDATPREVDVKAEGNKEITAYTEKYYNSKSSAEINGIKKAIVWEKDENGNIINYNLVERPGAGFTFGLYANEDITLTDGSDGLKKDYLIATETTGADGKLQFALDLPFGEYYVKELAAPAEHYTIPDTKYSVNVTTTETSGATIVVDAFEGELLNDFPVEPVKVKKINSETNEPMANVLISIRDMNDKVWCRDYTDENGELNVMLEPGKYIATEVETPEGYVINTEEYEFTVVADAENPVEIVIKNIPLKGTITIDKKGLQFVGVETKAQSVGSSISTPTETVNVVSYSSDISVPVFEDTYLANVKFDIIADEDIYSPDGKLQNKKGDVVETLTTSLEGSVTSKELWPGKYLVVETETNAGYQIDSTPKPVEVTNDGKQRVTSFTADFYNNRAPYEINVVKEMVKWETKVNGDVITQDTVVVPGANFVFGLFTAEDIALYNGNTGFKADTLVALSCTDEEGNLKFEGSLPFGSYYVKELAVPKYELSADGNAVELSKYKMSDKKYYVELSTDETTGQTIKVNASDEAILNDFDRFPVVITKTDLVTSEPVVGAKVNIYNAKGEVVYSQWTSDDGTLPDIILEPGTYTFEEIVAPDGYIRNTTVFEFTLMADGTVDGVVDFTNEPTKVTITKTDAVNGKPVEGAEITIYEASPDEATADEAGAEVYKALTDASGQINVSYLEIGKWYIYKETKAANGFAVNNNTFAFMINEDGTITGDTTLVDDYTRFWIHKVNEKDEPMSGVEFTMYDEQGNPVATATTDEAGIAEFVGFLEGSYTIKETKTWANYDLAPDSIKITNDGKWDNTSEAAHTTVKNYPTVIPPKTGDESNLPLWLGIACFGGAVIIAIIFVLYKKNKMK